MSKLDSQFSVIGRSIPKTDSIYTVTGEAKYLDDIRFPKMLYGKILRSQHPHAKILNIDTSAAEKLPGVKAVITADDTTKVKFCAHPITPNKMALADDRVRFVGDEVAAVAAVDEETAEEALELINVEYEVLPAVFDPEDAMELEAPKIYDECERNIASHFVRNFGDIGKGFQQADSIFEDRFSCPPVASCTLEPHGCIACFDISSRLTIWTTSQIPVAYQRELAGVLRMPMNQIRVINSFVGGGFGNKSAILPLEPIAAFLAKKTTNTPVKIINIREEEFISARTRYSMIIYLKTGARKDGTLTARQARVITNNGAYNNKGPAITGMTCSGISNLYRVPNVRTEAFIVYTNNQYGGALRGWGIPQAHFAVESQMDIIAEGLNMDPLELRLRNVNQAGDTTSSGWEITSCGMTDCLREAAKIADWDIKRKHSGLRGIGMAAAMHSGGGSRKAKPTGVFKGTISKGPGNLEEISLKVNSDGTVDVIAGTSEIGQGVDTVLGQIVAEEIGVRVEDVNVISRLDTGISPQTQGTWGSRTTYMAGNAAKLAAADAKQQLFNAASEIFKDVNISDLEAKDGRIFRRGSLDKSVSVSDAALYTFAQYSKSITSTAMYSHQGSNPPDPETGYGNPCPVYAFGAQVAEVEVDIETGKVKVLNITAAHDVGRAINPMLVEGQIEGGISMGIGYALLEELQWVNGKTLNPNFCTYKIVNSTSMPSIESVLIETVDPSGPFGAKGIGEPTIHPTAPAIANAIYNAVGVRIKDLPMTPDKILEELKKKR